MKHFIDDYFSNEYGELFSSKYRKLRKLKSYTNHKGYNMYRVSINGRVKAYSQHHISYWVNVSEFDTSDGLQIDHIDGNKQNNHYTNLRRISSKGNINNPVTKIKLYGRVPSNKCDIDLMKLKELKSSGMSITRLAKYFNCSRSTIKSRLAKR